MGCNKKCFNSGRNIFIFKKINNSENLNIFFESEKIKSIINIFHNGINWEWNMGDENGINNNQKVNPLIRNKVEQNIKQNKFEWHIDGISFHHKLMSKNISLIVLPYLQCNNSKIQVKQYLKMDLINIYQIY